MISRLRFFLNYAVFWLLCFIIIRFIFIIYHFDKTADLPWTDLLLSNLHGLRLDLSAMGYFLVLPGLIMVFLTFFNQKFYSYFIQVYTILLIGLVGVIAVADIELYKHWGYRIDATPLLYLDENATMPIGWGMLALLIILFGILAVGFYFLFKKMVKPSLFKIERGSWKSAILMLFITALLFVPIRGSLGIAPINTGSVYFHQTKSFPNHAAVNVVWNLGYNLSKLNKLQYAEDLLEKEKSEQYFTELSANKGETVSFLNTDKPNIVIIILESFTYKFVEPQGGIAGVAPNLSRIAKEGIMFTNAYSSGDRTDKGIVSILSGFPAQPTSSIIKFANKTEKLPFLSKALKNKGYTTGFTYGGDIDFANFRSYINNAHFDHVTHSEHFPDSLDNSKWGVHDEYVFKKFYSEVDNIQQPFFKVMLSLSSHEPFEVPMAKTTFNGNDEQSLFFHSAHYTDKALGEFFLQAKNSDWWDNTLVIITADHGHRLPDNEGSANHHRFKIPMIWTGGAIQKAGSVVETYMNQTDLANTLLGQLGITDSSFLFSQNVLQENHDDFAVYIFNNGFGYLNDSVHVIYDNVSKQYMLQEGVRNEKDLEIGKAYMQTIYSTFNRN